ncbi:hyaluronan and proteoglycan link protein 1a [Genypterus blacodes]|uniref:hyaluronan and proteoglycan link protein 1a n=1 Tax=Genypterus blacodes TaxID=154954 RepID=UPI003F776AF7
MMALLCITIISLTLAGSVFSEESTSSPIQDLAGPVLLKVKVIVSPGSNVTLPCHSSDNNSSDVLSYVGIRVKWTKVAVGAAEDEDVLLSMGFHKKTYGRFEDRVSLENPESDDASLTISDVSVEDAGMYRCEVINGIVDDVLEVELEVEGADVKGVVFPYSPHLGRYNLNFHDAEKACESQKAVVASFDQLFEAWKGGLDWCNAGWLNDGTVQYPITDPRGPCGGSNSGPGVRSYGLRNKLLNRFDVFCFAPAFTGTFYWLVQPERLTYEEAEKACIDDDAEIATVSHMYAAWKLEGFDRCDSGWLADGSVRYPISKPRKNCSPTQAAVRIVGFPDKQQKLYGVYCYKEQQ